jgi:hypothetical protein
MRLDCPKICRPCSKVLEKLIVAQRIKNYPLFIKLQVLLLCLQVPTTGPHPQTLIFDTDCIIILYTYFIVNISQVSEGRSSILHNNHVKIYFCHATCMSRSSPLPILIMRSGTSLQFLCSIRQSFVISPPSSQRMSDYS